MQLLDQFGNPVRRETLSKLVGEPGMASVRSAWSNSVASGLTPSRLAGIIASAAEGNLHDFLLLAEEMEERDPHYAAVLGVRKRAVSGVQPVVTPASDDPRDVKIADDVRRTIAEHDDFPELVENMLDALGKGFSAIEIDWHKTAKQWVPERFIHRPAHFFTFDQETGTELRLIDERDLVNGVSLERVKWIIHKATVKSGLVSRGGLARLVAFGWMCKSYTVKDWMAFVETYGLPVRIGRYGPEATTEDVDVLFRAVANVGTDAAAVLPKNMQIDFEQVANGPGNDIFEKLARWVDEQTSKAVLGQTMTSDNGSSMAQANVHNEVRYDVAQADARAVSGTLNRDLVKPYVAFHYGMQERYPRLSIVVEEVEDTNMVLTNAFRLVSQGLRVKQSELRSKLGFSEPDDNDEVIGGAKAPPAAKTKTARNRAEDPESGADPYEDLDPIEAELNADWEEVMGDVIDPIQELLETATSYEEATRLIREAFPAMTNDALISGLVKASVKSRAQGDVPHG